MHTDWQIVEGPYGLKVITPDKEAAWPDFFTSIKAANFPAVIEKLVLEIGVHGNAVGVNFPSSLLQLDPSASLPANTVEIYSPGLEDSVIPRILFYKVLYAFGEQLLKTKPIEQVAWKEAMQRALDALQRKIEEATVQ